MPGPSSSSVAISASRASPPSWRARDGSPATAGPADEAGLTPRELDVLRLLAEGLTDRQIGERLFISARTAQVHVSRIRSKLDADNRTAAAGAARRLGLLEPVALVSQLVTGGLWRSVGRLLRH